MTPRCALSSGPRPRGAGVPWRECARARRHTTRARACRARSPIAVPVVIADRLCRGAVSDHSFTQQLESGVRIFAIWREGQHRRSAIGDDDWLAGALHLAEELERMGLEARLGDLGH